MADQEFLASFAVEIDETGVARLQTVLEENRKLAEELAGTFDAASAAVRTLSEELGVLPDFSGRGLTAENLPGSGGLSLGLDFSQASGELDRFTGLVKQPLSLKADASGIVSAGRKAWESVRALFSEPVKFRAKAGTGGNTGSPERDASGGTAGARSAGADSTGIRQRLAGAFPAAGKSAAGASGILSLPAGLSAGASSAGSVTQNYRTVSAPVSIQVQASGADAEEIGQRLYDTAERYLLRTLRCAME